MTHKINRHPNLINGGMNENELETIDIDDTEEIDDDEADEELEIIESNIKKRNIHVEEENLLKQIGILDPKGLDVNPLTGLPYQNIYFDGSQELSKTNYTYESQAINFWSKLPMYNIREYAITTIYNNQVVLVISGTGSGKTVLTPKYALHALNYQGRIAITNPKRIPSKNNALFASQNLDVQLGDQVGLKHRGSDKTKYSENSKLIYCTDGYLLAQLGSDPLIKNLDCVIIDEAHERGVNIDLLLILLKRVLFARPEFKLIIMSATINESLFVDYFPQCDFKFATIEAEGKTNKPVDEYFYDDLKFLKKQHVFDTDINKKTCIMQKNGELQIRDDMLYLEEIIKLIIFLIQKNMEGDILVFVGGQSTAQKAKEQLHNTLAALDPLLNDTIFCEVLTANTSKPIEDLITHETAYKFIKNGEGQYTRKIIFATEVAESSITIDGLIYVIDSGIVHSSRYYSDMNITALEKRFIAKSSHMQRKGRVGRTQKGYCFNMFTKDQYKKQFQDYTTSPIYLKNLSDTIMLFITKYIGYVQLPFSYNNSINEGKHNEESVLKKDKKDIHLAEFLNELIEPPKEKDVSIIIEKLHKMDCIQIDETTGKATSTIIGRACGWFDIPVELSRMLVASYNYKCRSQMCDFLAFMEHTNNKGDISSLFISPNKMLKNKTEKEIKTVLKKYETVLKRFANPYGDILSIINIFQKYKENLYGVYEQDNKSSKDKLIKEKLSDSKFSEWITNNFLSKKKLGDIHKISKKQYQHKFKRFIDSQLALKMSEIKKTGSHVKEATIMARMFLRPGEKIQISDDLNENLLNSVLDGLLINVCKKHNKQFITCNPYTPVANSMPNNTSRMYGIEPNTFVEYSKKIFNYIVVFDISRIFTNNKLNMITIIPNSHINKLIADIQTQTNDPDDEKNKLNNIYKKQKLQMFEKCSESIKKYNYKPPPPVKKDKAKGKAKGKDKAKSKDKAKGKAKSKTNKTQKNKAVAVSPLTQTKTKKSTTKTKKNKSKQTKQTKKINKTN